MGRQTRSFVLRVLDSLGITSGGTYLGGTVVRGDVITGQGATPAWARLAKGTAGQVLAMDGTATDVAWATNASASPWMAWGAAAGITYDANPADFTTRGDGHSVLGYDDSTDQTRVFEGTAPSALGAGDLTVTIRWAAATATSGDVKWDVSFEAQGTDLDSASFAAARSVTTTTSGTSGIEVESDIVFSIAQADALAATNRFRIKVTRDTSVGGDMTGDAQLTALSVEQ